MLSLKSVENINQFLNQIQTYPLSLREVEVLESLCDNTNLSEGDLPQNEIFSLTQTVLKQRVLQYPSLSYNRIIWESLLKQFALPNTMPPITDQTHFIIGL